MTPRPWVSLTADENIKAELPQPAFHGSLFVIVDAFSGAVTDSNFKRANHEDAFRHLVKAARQFKRT